MLTKLFAALLPDNTIGLFNSLKNFSELKKQLDRKGVSPNSLNSRKDSLLEIAIRQRLIAQAALLAHKGANLNAAAIDADGKAKEATVIAGIFVPGLRCQSLAFFFLTYGADYHRYVGSTPFAREVLTQGSNYCQLYKEITFAMEAFKNEQYESAKGHFEAAVILLDSFILIEKKKLNNLVEISDTNQQTDVKIVEFYEERLKECKKNIVFCEEKLTSPDLSTIETKLLPKSTMLNGNHLKML